MEYIYNQSQQYKTTLDQMTIYIIRGVIIINHNANRNYIESYDHVHTEECSYNHLQWYRNYHGSYDYLYNENVIIITLAAVYNYVELYDYIFRCI